MARLFWGSTMIERPFLLALRNGLKRTASNARPFTSSHRTQPHPCSGKWKSKERLLHRDWSLYDTAHAVFRPRHMTPEELEQGYAWIYQRLFSHQSIWRRRPADLYAVPLYLAMSYL